MRLGNEIDEREGALSMYTVEGIDVMLGPTIDVMLVAGALPELSNPKLSAKIWVVIFGKTNGPE